MFLKNFLIGLLILILAILVAALSFIFISNSGVGARELDNDDLMLDWMARLDDETSLNEIYLPGTHDSGALYSFLGVSGKCQSYTIEEQLAMGVRFFDIRLQLRDNKLAVVHSFVDQKLSFDEVLNNYRAFLDTNPTEFIIVSIKQDADPENSSIPFEDAVEDALNICLDSLLNPSTSLPSSIGEARGKVHIVARYSNASIGVPANNGWADSTSFELGSLYVQDYYAIDSIESKMNDIAKAFDISKSKKHELVLNFTSCYLTDALPPAHAPTSAKMINPQLLELIINDKAAPCVFISDFVTPELIQNIINENFKK